MAFILSSVVLVFGYFVGFDFRTCDVTLSYAIEEMNNKQDKMRLGKQIVAKDWPNQKTIQHRWSGIGSATPWVLPHRCLGISYNAPPCPSDFTLRNLGVSVVVVLHSNVSASRFPHHFFVHRGPLRYQSRSGSRNGHNQDFPRIEAIPPASSVRIPHRDS